MNDMAKSPTTTVLTHNHAAASVMARILSTENISVVIDRKVSTASFDLKNRTLYLPEWESMSRSVYDMLIGHEISHALHTPCDGWRTAIDMISGTTNSNDPAWRVASLYLNVVEDARIERLIKDKFPGFKRDFVNAYNELSAKDFFGVKKIDLNTLTLADRINLYYKLGTIGTVGVRFTASEQTFITRIDACSSFDEAAVIAADLFRFCKEKQGDNNNQEQQNPAPSKSGKKSDGSDDQSDSGEQSNAPTTEPGESDEGKGAPSAGEGEDEIQGSEQNSPTGSDQGEQSNPAESMSNSVGSSNGNAPTPITQQNFNRNLEGAVADNSNRYITDTLSVPTRLVHPDISKVVVPFAEVLNQAKHDFPAMFNPTTISESEQFNRVRTMHDEYERGSKRAVDLLLKQFELRKAAQISKRASISKTGVLDMTRIPSYKFNEDLFRRNTRLPEGKNHGLVMFVDWSGSMSPTLTRVLEQCFVLVEFCRRAGIPFEVYAFSTCDFRTVTDSGLPNAYTSLPPSVWKEEVNDGYYSYASEGNDPTKGSVAPRGHRYFSLINLFSSKARKSDLKSMMHVCRVIADRSGISGLCSQRWDLGGTALDETIVSAMTIVPAFRDQNRLDIVHTVFLTDGETSLNYTSGNGTIIDPKTRAVYHHSVEGQTFRNTSTNTLLTAFRDITGSRAIGMYLTSRVSASESWFADRLAKQMPISEATINSGFKSHRPAYNQQWQIQQHAVKEVSRQLMDEFKENNMLSADKGSTGYDEFFIIRSDTRLEADTSLDKVSAGSTQNALKKAFTKSFNNNNKSRVLVNRFIELIAR